MNPETEMEDRPLKNARYYLNVRLLNGDGGGRNPVAISGRGAGVVGSHIGLVHVLFLVGSLRSADRIILAGFPRFPGSARGAKIQDREPQGN